jgi:hypothetical protein
MYGLRKIRKDGTNCYNDFVWPLTVGAEVVAPDWNTARDCGGGLHCLPNAQGDWTLLRGEYWAVLEFDEKDMVQIGLNKCKVKKCKIVFLSENHEGMLTFFDASKFDSRTAYFWAKNIGNLKIMIDRITTSYYAYLCAMYIGNREIMIDRITDSLWAYLWAMNIGNRDIMIDRIADSRWAYYWALYIGNRDIMIDRITDSYWAYLWARDIGNRDLMIARFPELKYRLAS